MVVIFGYIIKYIILYIQEILKWPHLCKVKIKLPLLDFLCVLNVIKYFTFNAELVNHYFVKLKTGSVNYVLVLNQTPILTLYLEIKNIVKSLFEMSTFAPIKSDLDSVKNSINFLSEKYASLISELKPEREEKKIIKSSEATVVVKNK